MTAPAKPATPAPKAAKPKANPVAKKGDDRKQLLADYLAGMSRTELKKKHGSFDTYPLMRIAGLDPTSKADRAEWHKHQHQQRAAAIVRLKEKAEPKKETPKAEPKKAAKKETPKAPAKKAAPRKITPAPKPSQKKAAKRTSGEHKAPEAGWNLAAMK